MLNVRLGFQKQYICILFHIFSKSNLIRMYENKFHCEIRIILIFIDFLSKYPFSPYFLQKKKKQKKRKTTPKRKISRGKILFKNARKYVCMFKLILHDISNTFVHNR